MTDENIEKEQESNASSSAKATADKLQGLEKKCDEYLNNWKRERADFLNYKKEEMERMGVLVKYANQEVILKVLPILDSIDLAEKRLPEKLKKGEGNSQAVEWTKGFLQIQNQIKEFLKKEGIEEIEAVGKKFDPNTMEVVEEMEGGESGIVIEELQKGYIMEEKVIRPSKVKISK